MLDNQKIDQAKALHKKGTEYAGQAVAAYAAFQKARSTAVKLVDSYSHTWTISEDYAAHLYRAGLKFASEHQKKMPGKRKKLVTGENYDTEGAFRSNDWVWVPSEFSSRLQARASTYGRIEFRSLVAKDLEVLREHLVELSEEMRDEATVVTVKFDFTEPSRFTSIYGWEETRWAYRSDRRSRTFKSVFLPKEQQDAIEGDLTAFRGMQARMQRLEMPWRRGYLLSGPPGTGKTSTALAIAGQLGFDLGTLSLSDMKSDEMLRKAISNLPGSMVVVIEDIDAHSVAQDRVGKEEVDSGLTLSGLLNALDGFETPDGLVTILTTNHPEKLDEALTRHGRIDQHFHLGYVEAAELERLFAWFYEQESPKAPACTAEAGIAPAEAAEILKRHLDDPEAGWNALLNRIASAVSHFDSAEFAADIEKGLDLSSYFPVSVA